MARLIDADALVDELEELSDSYIDNNCDAFTRGVYNVCRQQGVDAAIEVVKEQTPIDAVKHGHWILDENEKIPCYQIKTCSLCGCRVNGTQFNFCPRCGAKMDGEHNVPSD